MESRLPICPLCIDTGVWTGYVETQDGQTRIPWLNAPCPDKKCLAGQAEKQRRAQAQIEKLFGDAQINEKWRGATLADFGPLLKDPIHRRLEGGRGSFLWGDYGVGKTRLLVASLYSRMSLGETALYLTVPKLLLRIKATFNRGREHDDATEAEIVETAASVRWLGLDDLGVEASTPWARAELFQIVNERYDRDLPIIGTSNLSFDELESESLLGRRVTSRLREMCGRAIEMRGDDRREATR